MANDSTPGPPIALISHLRPSNQGSQIPVRISFEIIRLFSEGLYQSPHKAIEELVANSFDAGAETVSVLLPRSGEDAPDEADSLWVVDDGSGMDQQGFELLWRVADSHKYAADSGPHNRRPIGQFGIGKLAAYVLAWRLTHVSKVGSSYRYTSMNFRDVLGHHQYDPSTPLVHVALHEITEEQAKELLSELQERDSVTWNMLFGTTAATSWTAAALSDFKDLFNKLREGTLSWVLRTGLPLSSDFSILLNGQRLVPSKADVEPLAEFIIGGSSEAPDEDALALDIPVSNSGIYIDGIDGRSQAVP